MTSSINRALMFQGGGSLGAYEAGAYKAIKEELSQYSKAKGMGNEPIFHIVSGTSIGAINAAVLVSYVKENKTWEGSDERLVEFWEYLSTQSSVEKIPYLTYYWIGILGIDWIDELLQESLPGDINVLLAMSK